MSRSAYDVGREALRLWRSVHGNASLNQQCQRFDGYYWQWAYQGNENITAYGTATAAANASSIYTSNINDPNAQPGDLWYWWWASDGHVATVLGHDAAGRVLVTHTSSSGDVVEQWTNNVRISHADTIPLSFRGGSHTDGANARRTGLTAWPNGGALQPHERRVTAGDPANGRSQPNTSSGVAQQLPGGDSGEFDGWIYGETVSGNRVWFRGKFSQNWFWSGGFTDTSTTGLTDLNPRTPADPTKRVTSEVSRVRSEPNTSSSHVKTYDLNTTHTILGWKNGETIEGSKVWFKTADGWVWAGNFTDPSTKGLADLNAAPEPAPEPTPESGDFTPNIVTPTASDFPAWIRYEVKLKPGVTTQRNVEDAEYYGMKYDPVESHSHWWGEPGKSGTHDSNVTYLNGSDTDANYVVSAGRVTLTIPLNILAYTTGKRNPYGWKTENDPALTELGYKTLGYVHYIVEKLNPKLSNEPIRLHKEFSETSCSEINVARVRNIATQFKTGALDPATGEPTQYPDEPEPTPWPTPEPSPNGLAELIQLAITFLKRILGIK